MTTALYPGSFDPITLGHLNIIRRAAYIFDKVFVCVSINSEKKTMFTLEERVAFAKKSVERFPNVEVVTSEGLFAVFAKQFDNPVIVKGLRSVTDFEYELQIASVNRRINPALETIFMTASEKYTFLSSSIVREMIRYNSELSDLVPREILEDLKLKSKEYKTL